MVVALHLKVNVWARSMPAILASRMLHHDVGRGKKRRSCPSRVALIFKIMLQRTQIKLVQSSWFSVGAFNAAATHPCPTGVAASLLSALLRPNQAGLVFHGDARPLAGRPAPLGSAPGFKWGRLQYMEEGDPVTTLLWQPISTNQLTANGQWQIWQWYLIGQVSTICWSRSVFA